MGLVSTQTGQKINLKKGYESRTISYQDWRKQQDQKRAAASQTVISAAAEAVRGKVGGMGVGSFAPSAAAAPQTSAGQSWDAGLTGQERREKQETVHRWLDALNRQALDPAVNQNPVRMNQLNQQMKALRASIGEQTVSDRVESGLGAAAASAGAGYVNLAGLAAGTVHNADYNRRQIAAMQKALETGKLSDGKPVTAGIRKSLENSIAKMQKEAAAWESPSSFQSRAYRAADSAAERSAQLTAEAKGGLGTVGRLAADVGIAGAQMGGDALIAALTGGTSLIPMAVRAAGGGAQEARQMGANSDQQWAYGLGSAALSVGTEKISNIAGPFKKMFGTGAAEKIAGKLVGRFGENQAVKLMTDLSKTAAGRIALSAIGEGSEEVVEDILQPFLKRATFDPNARFDAGEAGHDFLVGAILGGLGGVPEAVGSARAGTVQNQAETGTGADVRTPAGVETAPAESGVRGVKKIPTQQNAAPGTGTAVNENGLTALTALERENLSSGKRNKVVSTFQEAVSFVKNAIQNKQSTDRAYLGKVPDATARMVLEQTGVDITGYNAMMLSDSIRHMFNHHGDPIVEDARGQIPLTPEVAARIPDVLAHPDKVSLSPQKNVRGLPVLLFEKMIDGYYTTAQAVADGTHSIQADTLYIRKKAPQDAVSNTGESASPEHNVRNVLPQEPFGDTSATSANLTITQPSDSVKARGADPLMEAIFSAQKRVDQSTLSPEQFDHLADLNEKGAVGMDAAGKVYRVDPAEHIDRRSMGSVGERGVNAFQFDHPELHSYYVRAAEALIADADLSMQFPTVRRYEQGGQGRQVRQSAEVSAHLRQAMDETGLSRAQLIDVAKRIVEDHGQENVAAAKRVEIILDSMLENGWISMTGKRVPPNQAYIDAKGRIAGSRAGEARESYIPPELDAVDESGTVGDDGLGAADAGSLNSDYDRLQAQSDTFHPEGAHAARPVDVPTRDFDGYNIPKSASTMMGAEILHDTNVRQLEQMVADGSLSFETIHDKDAVLYADRILRDKGFDAALEQYRNAARSNVATKGNVALGQLLMRQAAAAGNTDALAELFHLYASNSTTIAQAMQAQSLLRKLPPESQLVTVQKALDALNEKYGTDVQLEQADIKAFLEAGDQEAREAVRQKIVEKASQAVPGTFKAKFDAWRYLAMLGNPRTHIRNLTGNLFFQPLAATKNRVGALEEVLVNSISGKKAERTKSVTGAAPWGKLAKEARADWANAEEFLGRTSKYMEGQTSLWEIEQNADPFQQSGRVGKAVGWLADKNGRLLEAEDTLFKRWIYSQSLAGYLKANGVKSIADADPGLLNRARNYAAQEALRNTFNDKNAFSDAVAKLGGARNSSNPFIKAGGYLVEGVLPFKRTPANVLARGVEYSPIGAAASMVDLVHKGVTGQAAAETVAQGLDRLAAGLSGSALLAAGFLLGGAGYITGGEGDDRDQNAFDDLTGHQSYALETADGTSVTLDWLAPEAIPFFMGVELQRALLDRGMSLEDAWNVVKNTSEPMLEMSMLQGLNDMFESAAYARNKGGSVMGAVASSAFTNYFTQALPTLFGQLERTAEDRRMTTYTDSGSPLPRDVQYLLGKAGQKIPGWDYSQIPYVDAWGREEETGDALERAVKNLFSPAYTSQVQVDEVERELQRIKDATGDGGVFPDRAPRFFQADGNRKNLTAEEYLEYAKERGQESYRMVREGVGLPEYRSMTDQERAGFIADLYKYADQNARAGISDYEVDPWVKNARSAREDIGVSPAEYIALYRRYGSALLSGTGYDKTKQAVNAGLTVEQYVNLRNNLDADGNGSVSQAEAQAALDASSDLSRSQKADLWSIINKSWKKNPYR